NIFCFQPSPRLDVVAEQYILVAQVQFAVGNDRVRPGRLLTTVGLVEAATLDVALRVRLNQEQGAILGAIVESAICQAHGAFRHPVLAALARIPDDVAGLEVKPEEEATLFAPIGTIQATVE